MEGRFLHYIPQPASLSEISVESFHFEVEDVNVEGGPDRSYPMSNEGSISCSEEFSDNNSLVNQAFELVEQKMSNEGSISCSEEISDNNSLVNQAFELVEQKASQEQQLLDQQRCSLPMNYSVYKQDPPDRFLLRQQLQHPQLQSNSSEDRHISNVSFKTASFNDNSDNDDELTAGNQRRFQRSNTQPYDNIKQEPAAKVLITYADVLERSDGMRSIHSIHRFLMRNNVEAKVDFMEDIIRSMSNAVWVDTQLNECDFVMICISPVYAQVVQDRLAEEDKQRGNAQQAMYIYRQLHQEFIQNHARNFRFLPMLVDGGTLSNVPRWLKDTKIYRWPEDFEDIMYRILKINKYQKPKRGRTPTCTIRTYAS